MVEKYLDDYYKNKINATEIGKIEGYTAHQVSKYFKNNNILTIIDIIGNLKFDNKQLKTILRSRYTSIINRCLGRSSDRYGYYKGKSICLL